MHEQQYDVIIIGAGLGGLLSAAQLVQRGKRVAIVERLPHGGGQFTAKTFQGAQISTDLPMYRWSPLEVAAFWHVRASSAYTAIAFLMLMYSVPFMSTVSNSLAWLAWGFSKFLAPASSSGSPAWAISCFYAVFQKNNVACLSTNGWSTTLIYIETVNSQLSSPASPVSPSAWNLSGKHGRSHHNHEKYASLLAHLL